MNAAVIDDALVPNTADIKAHIYALCDPAFTLAYPNAVLEIAYGSPSSIDGGDVNRAQTFSALSDKELQEAAESAASRTAKGWNAYIGVALRTYGATGRSRRIDAPRSRTISPRGSPGSTSTRPATTSAFQSS